MVCKRVKFECVTKITFCFILIFIFSIDFQNFIDLCNKVSWMCHAKLRHFILRWLNSSSSAYFNDSVTPHQTVIRFFTGCSEVPCFHIKHPRLHHMAFHILFPPLHTSMKHQGSAGSQSVDQSSREELDFSLRDTGHRLNFGLLCFLRSLLILPPSPCLVPHSAPPL